MSVWINKNKNKISIGIPIDLIIPFIGIFTVIIIPHFIGNIGKFYLTGLLLSLTGLFFVLIAKISMFQKNKYKSFGAKEMKPIFKFFYYIGYIFIIPCIFFMFIVANVK